MQGGLSDHSLAQSFSYPLFGFFNSLRILLAPAFPACSPRPSEDGNMIFIRDKQEVQAFFSTGLKILHEVVIGDGDANSRSDRRLTILDMMIV